MNIDIKRQSDLLEDVDVVNDLQRWCALSKIQRRALIGLANEVDTSSGLIERSVSDLSDHFLLLAKLAQGQATRISDFADETTRVEFEGHQASISDVFSSLDESLSLVVSKILNLSKKSVNVCYVLDDMDKKIESLRSKLEDDAAVGPEVQALKDDLKVAKNDFKEIAEIDLSHSIMIKDNLANLMSYLIVQSQNMEETLNESAKDSRVLSQNIAEIVTKMQFQDRTSQRLGLISSTLSVISETLSEMETGSSQHIGERGANDDNVQWIETMVSNMHLGEMRERFVNHLMFDESSELFEGGLENEASVEHAQASDDIELF